MKKLLIIVFLVGIGVGYFIPHDDSCVWNLWDDPRGCVIKWDDGTYSYKSPIVELGTLHPGESKEVMIASIPAKCWCGNYISALDPCVEQFYYVCGNCGTIYTDTDCKTEAEYFALVGFDDE